MRGRKVYFAEIERILLTVSEGQWEAFVQKGKSTEWHEKEWWNNKYYKKFDDWDPSKERFDTWGNREIPIKRKIFYPRPNSRFGCKNQPIAYFSQDFAINCSETIKDFRDNEALSWENDLKPYLEGELNPTSSSLLTGVPLSFRLKIEAVILDLTCKKHDLIQIFQKINPDFLNSILLSRNENVYFITQTIALVAWKNGFDGILFKSARAPSDIKLPDANLVMFNEKIERYIIPNAANEAPNLSSEN